MIRMVVFLILKCQVHFVDFSLSKWFKFYLIYLLKLLVVHVLWTVKIISPDHFNLERSSAILRPLSSVNQLYLYAVESGNEIPTKKKRKWKI